MKNELVIKLGSSDFIDIINVLFNHDYDQILLTREDDLVSLEWVDTNLGTHFEEIEDTSGLPYDEYIKLLRSECEDEDICL